MSVYNPTGAGGVHVDTVMSGKGRGGTVSGVKKAAPAKKAAAGKKLPFGGKQAAPFGKKAMPTMMGDVPGLLDAGDRRVQAKKVATSKPVKRTPTRMQAKTPPADVQRGASSPAIPASVSKGGEVGVTTPRQTKQADTMVKRNTRKLPGQAKGIQ